jgi:hypothetical protein
MVRLGALPRYPHPPDLCHSCAPSPAATPGSCWRPSPGPGAARSAPRTAFSYDCRVLKRDLPTARAVGDQERNGDLLDDAVEVDLVAEATDFDQ